jgi:hypothetical protein
MKTVVANGTKKKTLKWTTLEAVEVAIGAEALDTLHGNARRRREKGKESQAKAKENLEEKFTAKVEVKHGRKEDMALDRQREMHGKEARRKGKASWVNVGPAERRGTDQLSARRKNAYGDWKC